MYITTMVNAQSSGNFISNKHRIYYYITAICLTVCFIISFPSPAVSDNQKKILVLHSYHQGLVWTDDIMEGIYSVFNKDDMDIEINVEYMDTKRYFDGFEGKYLTRLRDMYKDKYGTMNLDIIISSDDNAFQFLLMHHDELFPGTPVVFCGVNDFEDAMLAGHELVFTGVLELLDPKASIDLALKLHPKAREIAIITETTISGSVNRNVLEQLADQYKGTAEFIFLDKDKTGLTLQELLGSLRQLKETSVVFYSDFLRSKGVYINQEVAVPEISRTSRRPVYTQYDEILGLGVVGGKLVNGHSHGQKAAEMAKRILQGAPVNTLPVHKESVNTYMFDYEQLTRFNIDTDDLPEGSIFINRPFSFYMEYKALVWAVMVIFVFMILSLAAIFLNVVRRKKAERELKKAHDELEQKVENRTNALGIANIDLQSEIDERARAEEQIKKALKEKELLLQEIHHRVKNNLTVVHSLLGLQAKHIYDERDREMFRESINRIKSMAMIHEKLYDTKDLANIDFSAYLKHMLKDMFMSYNLTSDQITLNIDENDVTLRINSAIPCGLIINELVSNSLKHAFPDNMKGEIHVALNAYSKDEIELLVRDNGIGIPESLNIKAADTLGMNLVNALIKQLQGTIEINREKGSEFRITFRSR